MDTTHDPKAAMPERIQSGLRTAEAHARRLKRLNTRLIWLSLIGTSLATVLAGVTAAAGPLAGEGTPAWRLTCGAIAVLTALSGLLSGFHQRMNISERLANALACAGRLRGLELALTVTGRNVQEVAADYEDVVTGYQEYIV
jgi:hypothetical protein